MSSNHHSLPAMTLAALGIVYGDIGTSPLYTLRESFLASQLPVDERNVLGFVSLIIWALLLVVTLKYVIFILHADNKGEGGVVVLMRTALQKLSGKPAWLVLMMGLAGTSLFYGDAMITPAVSVLSAIEGLTVVSPQLSHFVLPLALVVLVGLFAIQKHGTQRIGSLFGPVMLLWFTVLAGAGIYQISMNPIVLKGINPIYGLDFVLHHGWEGFVSLGAVVLAVTGAEALYADMGHFGRKPIQVAWLGMVLPALAINYIGQGALLLREPASIQNPFFLSVPSWGLVPLILLATVATVIASQAVISGAFSLARQAVQLGFAPRMKISHTSETEIGQIYMPTVNWMLLGVVVCVVMGFQSSGNLAAAYGIAATGTMILTTLMFSVVMRKNWHWPMGVVVLLTGTFLTFDLIFFSSNLLKLPNGGWFPVLVAGIMVFNFSTWRRGREQMQSKLDDGAIDLNTFLQNLEDYPPQEVAGNAIYMVSNAFSVPRALLHNLKHNKVLHERNILLTIKTEDVPYVAVCDRLAVKQLSPHFTRIIASYGFQETPNVHHILARARELGLNLEMMESSFFLSRDSIDVADKRPENGMWRMRVRYFRRMYRNSTAATDYYQIPANKVVEMGQKVVL